MLPDRISIVHLRAIILFTSLCISSGCSDVNQWTEFDKYKIRDMAGKPIDCDQLVSMQTESNTRTYDLADYLYYQKHTFKQCGPEIDRYIEQFCRTHLESAIKAYTDTVSGNDPGDLYAATCRAHIDSEFQAIDSRYDLLKSAEGFLVLHDAGKMLRLQNITEISFYEVYVGGLWRIDLHTEDDWIPLYFGDKRKWEKAKSDFAALPLTRQAPPSSES